MDEIFWQTVRMPQPLSGDEYPTDRYFLVDDGGSIVAEFIGYDGESKEYTSYEVLRRLNQWEEQNLERMKEESKRLRREMGLEDQVL